MTKTLPFVKLQPDGRIWPLPPEGKPSEVIHYRLQMIWYIHFISDMDTRIASLTMSMMYWWCGKIFKSDWGIPLRIISILLYLKLKHIPSKIKVWVGWSQIHCTLQCNAETADTDMYFVYSNSFAMVQRQNLTSLLDNFTVCSLADLHHDYHANARVCSTQL